MQEGIQNDVVVMDFAKAFDKVAHNRLFYKLSSYWVKGNTLGWIGSFLSGRSQNIILKGKSSSSVPVLSGVTQGSVLGPVLFLIYINDLPEHVSNSTVRLFADGILLYLTIHNSSDCDKLQEDLNNLERWESDWQMSFHPEKCEVIHITTKKTPILHSYSLHGHILSSVPQIKYLVIHISQGLKWNAHINSTSSKATQTLGFLKRNLRINSNTVKKKKKSILNRPVVYTTDRPGVFLILCRFVVYTTSASYFKVFPYSLPSCFFIRFSIVITSPGEKGDGICASRVFVCSFCTC